MEDTSKKYFTSDSLKVLVDNIKSYINNAVANKANTSHTHSISNITNLQSALDGKANSNHNHSASNITSGTLSSDRLPTVPINKGGTGSTTASGALINLGLTATASELNVLDGITASTTELNYVDGVSSNIQTQLNNKASSTHTHSYLPLSGGTVSSSSFGSLKIARSGSTNGAAIEFSNSNGVLGYVGMTGAANGGLIRYSADTNSSYTVLDSNNYTTYAAKASHNHNASNINAGTLSSDRLPTVPISKGGTGATTAASALTNLGLTATATELNKLDGIIVTTDELNTLDGAASNIQTQLNGKASSDHTHTSITDGTMSVKAQSNNEVNFGGSNNSSTIYFGYRALDSKAIPSKFVFGGSTGTANVTATSFTGSGASLTSLNASNISSGTLAADRLATSGVTAGSYGPSGNASPAHSGTFNVPYITVDAKGRVTAASTKTITLPTDTDTKNTAGSTDTSSKIFLVGATSQAANPQTYSHDTAYVGTDGCLYSNSTKVSVDGHNHDSAYLKLTGGSVEFLTVNGFLDVVGGDLTTDNDFYCNGDAYFNREVEFTNNVDFLENINVGGYIYGVNINASNANINSIIAEDITANGIRAEGFYVTSSAYLTYDSTNKCLNFNFI